VETGFLTLSQISSEQRTGLG